MPKPRQPPVPSDYYEVQLNPNLLAIALAQATEPLREEMRALQQEVAELRAQQRALVAGFEHMQQNHTEQLRLLVERLRQSYPEDERD